MKTILVTGATGFVGSHVVRRLASWQDTHVRGLIHSRPRPAAADSVEYVEGDLTRPETLPSALEGVQLAVHAAAVTADTKEPYPGAYDQINRTGTENLVAEAATAGVDRMVVVSGLGTHPAQPGTYMATRWAMEEAVRQAGLPYVILRPSVLFGDRAPFVSALARLASRVPVLPLVGGGGRRFQLLWIEDLVTCIERSLVEGGPLGQEVTVGGADQLSFREVMTEICRALGVRRVLLPLPLTVARVQATLMAAVLPHPPLTPAALELFEFDNVTDPDSVEHAFGFRPRGFREHVRERGLEI